MSCWNTHTRIKRNSCFHASKWEGMRRLYCWRQSGYPSVWASSFAQLVILRVIYLSSELLIHRSIHLSVHPPTHPCIRRGWLAALLSPSPRCWDPPRDPPGLHEAGGVTSPLPDGRVAPGAAPGAGWIGVTVACSGLVVLLSAPRGGGGSGVQAGVAGGRQGQPMRSSSPWG